jgi:hypothetical protein
MRLDATLERAAGEDARRYQRVAVRLGAGFEGPERPSSRVAVVDLSTHGCGIEIDSHVESGARVWIKLPGLQSWKSRVVWSDNGRAGLEFESPLHPAVVDRYR